MFENRPLRDIARYYPTAASTMLLVILDTLIGLLAWRTGTRWALDTAIVGLFVIGAVGLYLAWRRGEFRRVTLRWNGEDWERVK